MMRPLLLATTTYTLALAAAPLVAQQFPATKPSSTPPPFATSPAESDATPAPAAAETPAPLATRQTTFTIPFAVDPRGGAQEVELHVSTDQGKSWTLDSRQTPSAKEFLFRAPHDGEYWFASRAVDAQGRGAELDKLAPELRVRVDTAAPVAELTARVGKFGEIIAQWTASDDDLILESLKVEYAPAGEREWKAVPLDKNSAQRDGNTLRGEVTWHVASKQRAINLRITARDGAGNAAIVNRGVYLPASRGTQPSEKSPAPLDVDPFRSSDLKTSHKPPQKWPAETTPGTPAPTTPAVAEAFPRVTPVTAPVSPPVAGEASAAPPTSPLPPLGTSTSFPPLPEGPRTTDAPAREDVPAGEQPTFTAKKRFKLDYDADDVPPEHISAVELWGTHDAGKTWLKWGTDPDKQSPFEVEVEREGVFGFRIVVVHINGMAGHTPKAGDTADLWVGVDEQLPVAKLGSVTFGKGTSAGQLCIEWTASDDWLTPRPIALSYASEPSGPWTPIEAGLANTGQYYWRVGPNVPRKIYLKLEARDIAGNVAEDRLSEPLELEVLVPRGRIRGIE